MTNKHFKKYQYWFKAVDGGFRVEVESWKRGDGLVRMEVYGTEEQVAEERAYEKEQLYDDPTAAVDSRSSQNATGMSWMGILSLTSPTEPCSLSGSDH